MKNGAGLDAAVAGVGAELLRSNVATAAAPIPTGSLVVEAALDLGGGRLVCVVADEAEGRWTVPVVRDGTGVRRARAGDGVAEALLDLLGGDSVAAPFALSSYGARGLMRGERAMGVDQTNESVVVGEAAVVKWSLYLPRRGVAAAAPSTRRLTALADAGFGGMPQVWGLLVADLGDPDPVSIATVTAYLQGAVDGWEV